MKWLWVDVHTAHVDWVFWNPLLNLESAMHWINNRVANTKWLPDKGKYINIKAEIGLNLLKVAKKNHIKLEGTCGGEMLCTTCHVHILSNHINKIKKQSLEEKEILSLAENLKKNSRLACQIEITSNLDGLIFCIA